MLKFVESNRFVCVFHFFAIISIYFKYIKKEVIQESQKFSCITTLFMNQITEAKISYISMKP